MENNFRNAMFGGFNREDVTAYITRIAAEYKETDTALQQERECRSKADAEAERLREEAERLRSELEELRCQLRQEGEERARLSRAAVERDELRHQAESLGQTAEEYRELKEHIAQIELDAHRRADDIVAEAERQAAVILTEAKQQAEAVRAGARAQVEEVARVYAALLADFSVARDHVSGELRKMDTALTQLPIAFDRMGSEITTLRGMVE